jgi:arsenate reductase
MSAGMRWRASLVWIAVVVGVVAPSATHNSPLADEQANRRPGKADKPPTVLFMCPHGAAKSVLASAYFLRLAKERGLNVRVESAGTEPDAEVSPAVAAHLAKHGYAVPIPKPRRVTSKDLATADVIISLGCDLKDLPVPPAKLRTWDEVPSPSEDFARADEAIRKRVIDLVEELVRKREATR